jgi:predicted enzyme related to lactoylglutathione lyase
VRAYQLSSRQAAHAFLHCALGEARGVGNHLVAGTDIGLLLPLRFAPQMKVDEESGRNVVVADQVSHQHMDHVVVQSYHFLHYSIFNYYGKSDIDRIRPFGYSRSMIKGIKFASVPVTDQDRALSFYTEKLGFRILTDQPFDDKQRWIELSIPGAETGVVLFTPDGHRDRIGTFSAISFHCDDLQKTYDDFAARGVEFAAPPTKQPWGSFAIFKDPDGNQFVMSAR